MPPRRKPAAAAEPTVSDRVRVATPPPAQEAEYDPFANYSTQDYSPPVATATETPVYNGAYNPNAYTPDTYAYTPAKVETYNSNAYTQPNTYNTAAYNTTGYNTASHNTTGYNNSAYNTASHAPESTYRYTSDDNSYSRRRSPARRSRSPSPRRRRSPSPPRNRGQDRRRAPAIPTVVALDLLSWIPAHIWREHGYQPPVKLK
jgi:hypothetical protein